MNKLIALFLVLGLVVAAPAAAQYSATSPGDHMAVTVNADGGLVQYGGQIDTGASVTIEAETIGTEHYGRMSVIAYWEFCNGDRIYVHNGEYYGGEIQTIAPDYHPTLVIYFGVAVGYGDEYSIGYFESRQCGT